MATQTTPTSPAAWRPDVTAYVPGDVIPDALILTHAIVAGSIEGDEPSVRVPFVADDGTVGIVAEGAAIPDAGQDFDEVVIQTDKVATLGKYSYETLQQPNAAKLVTDSLQRSIVRKANALFLGSASNPTGLLNVSGVVNAGTVTADLDPMVDAIAAIEDAGGTATNIVASPSAWAEVSKLKTGTDSNVSIVGAGTAAGTRALLSLPVTVTPDMPDGGLLVVDRNSIVAAVGNVRVARSEEAFFVNDVVAIRVTFRLGWGVMHPGRLAKLTAPTPGS
ncbi:phage major capsid protein [Mycolicibacterium arenosum]|uniref:Phage major capsid protein n=1 Tax=Mycolicibacterium arenosum TaxID=2952157 RepID=A0ABT1M3E7_9MYCO|nr:phage major capsid protein [Mycolicibacterium sp. CAU 1645]MCP9272774.1 phage major capsid protein [Mycolicibacterium sp. CAU 1645]